MPPLKSVKGLEDLCLGCLAHIINRTCSKKAVKMDDIKENVATYFSALPLTHQQAVYRTFLNCNKHVHLYNEKHIAIGIFMGCDELRINVFLRNLVLSFDKIGTKYLKENKIKHVSIHSITAAKGFNEWCIPVFDVIKLFENLTTLHVRGECSDYMLKIVAQNCPLIEKINIDVSPDVSNTGIAYLCGFESERDALTLLHWVNKPQLRKSCSKLKYIYFNTTGVSALSAAFLLRYCKNIEVIDICPKIDLEEVLNRIYGTDENLYVFMRDQYRLIELDSSDRILEESHLSLLFRVCPFIAKISLRFTGRQRVDKNLIANLCNTKITSLCVIDCNMEVLLWYLKDYGLTLLSLNIKLMLSSMESASLSRSAIYLIMSYCPNLKHISLSVCGSPSIINDQPNINFNTRNSLKHLESLSFQGISVTPEDLELFLGCANKLKKIHMSCIVLELSIDYLVDTFFSSRNMENLVSFYIALPNPVLNVELLRKIIYYCPLLREIGPLSLWNMSRDEYLNFSQEITDKNWNLDIEDF